MDTKRQYEDPKDAEKYLLFVKKFHHDSRLHRLGVRPRKIKNNWNWQQWDGLFKTIIPLRVEIIDTDHAQLSITEFLT